MTPRDFVQVAACSGTTVGVPGSIRVPVDAVNSRRVSVARAEAGAAAAAPVG